MKPLSLDLRQRIVAALQAGHSQASTAERFAVSLSSVERLARKQRQQQSLAPGKGRGKKPLVECQQHEAFAQMAASRTHWTLLTLAAAWQQQGGKAMSQASVSRMLRRLGFSYKKRAVSPASATQPSATRSDKR
jgi:transposase